jgi:hypothetical protein
MARTTVEILGGQLDGAVLQNAASEATLRDLVKAINGSGGGGGSGTLGRTPMGMVAGGVVGALGGAVKGAVNQIGNVTGAVGSFAGMMLKGEGRISAYTNVLNKQVISQLPLVGRYLGAVGGAVSGTIQEFERWNKTLQGLTGTGATFGNSIITMMNASAKTYMSLDDFSALVQKNTNTFVALGNTVTQGAQAFSEYSEAVLQAHGPARTTLINMGYTIPVINQQLAEFLENNYRGTTQDRIDKTKLANSFVDYQLHIHKLTALTGKRSDQLTEEMREVQNDTAFKLKLSRMDEKERTKINKALAQYTALYGKEAANIFKAKFLGLQPANEAAAEMMMMFPGLIKSMDRTLAQAQDTTVDTEIFNTRLRRERAEIIHHGAKQLDEFAPLLKAGSVGVQELATTLGVSQDIASFIARKGIDVRKMSVEEIENMLKEMDKEVEDRERLTQILRQFEAAMGEFKKGFLEVMTDPNGLLMTFSKQMEQADLPAKIRKFGTAAGQIANEYLPKFTEFLLSFTTPEGRAYYRLRMQKMLDQLGIYMVHYIPKMFGFGGKEDDLAKELERLDKFYDPKLRESRAARDMAVDKAMTGQGYSSGTVDPSVQPYTGQPAGGKVVQNQIGSTALARNQAISPQLESIFSQAGKIAGVDIRVESGGQMPFSDWETLNEADPKNAYQKGNEYFVNGKKVRVGSKRHDGGNAADIDIYHAGTNERVTYNNPVMLKFLKALKAGGITNIGMGENYMQGGNRIHAGINTGYATWADDDGTKAYRDNLKKTDPAYQVIKQAGFRYGTLGATGQMFAQLGGLTSTELHGEEAVVSPAELSAEMGAAAENSLAGVENLNNNLSMLISLMSQRNDIASRINSKMASKSTDLFAAVS